ncbi:ribose-phosphate diphosphokinase [Aquibium sp. LZ166]|uniref:ribose-phosphate diphosphokinase n=1 Tax=Aquibium pacificus TaxID=3153579 RepID=A0ABV3SGG4_9HYPH
MRLFALKGTEALGASIAAALGHPPDAHEERDFEDGEHKARPLVSVRGQAVYVVHALDGMAGASANDKLVKLLFFIAACRENGASSVTAIVPYLAYARKDRQTKSRDPVTTRYVAQLFEAVGTDCLITLEVHNFAAFQNAFRCRTLHLESRQLFVPVIRRRADGLPVTVFSPDGGGVKRAQLLKEALESEIGTEVGFGFMEKRRSRGVVSGDLFAGDVEDRVVFIVDDMISTGGTILRAASACRERGAKRVFALAAHGLFRAGIEPFVDSPDLEGVVVTDTVAAAGQQAGRFPGNMLEVVSCGPMIAETIRRLETGEPLSGLLGMED